MLYPSHVDESMTAARAPGSKRCYSLQALPPTTATSQQSDTPAVSWLLPRRPIPPLKLWKSTDTICTSYTFVMSRHKARIQFLPDLSCTWYLGRCFVALPKKKAMVHRGHDCKENQTKTSEQSEMTQFMSPEPVKPPALLSRPAKGCRQTDFAISSTSLGIFTVASRFALATPPTAAQYM